MAGIKPVSEKELKAFVTDEIAQEEGYPSAEVYWLESELSKLAGKWRSTKDDAVVKTYHELFFKLISMGWNPKLLDTQGLLPSELMPQEYKNLK